MKIQFEIPDAVFNAAERYTLDPLQHAASMFEHWAQLAQQENPGLNVLELPTLAEKAKQQEAKRIKDNEEAEAANVERKRAEAAEADAALQRGAEQDKIFRAKQQAEIEARAVVLAQAMMQTIAPQAAPIFTADWNQAKPKAGA